MFDGPTGAWHASLALRVRNAGGRSLFATEHRGPLRVQKALDPEGDAPCCHAVALHPAIDAAVRSAVDCPADALGSASVQYAINSERHEAMYSRLYRS